MKLPDDPQIENLIEQLVATCSAVILRAKELGFPVDERSRDTLIASVLGQVHAGATKAAALPTGPVVDLAAARAAKAPRVANSFSITIPDLSALDALATRLHGEANHATRGLVLTAAFEAGWRELSRPFDEA